MSTRYRAVRFAALILAATTWCAVGASAAETLPRPTGQALLTVTGNIERLNDNAAARFDLTMIGQVGVKTVTTSTPWRDGAHVFEGVLLRDLLASVGAAGQTVRARGLSDYFVDIPYSDLIRYPVMVAYKMDGAALPIRDGGPLWIVYPRDGFPELRNPLVSARSLWQLVALDVR